MLELSSLQDSPYSISYIKAETNNTIKRRKCMKKSLVFYFGLFLSAAVYSQTDSLSTSLIEDCLVKKNGVYYADLDKETNIYLRFHDGDTVVTTSSVKDIDKASLFVNKDLGKGMLFGRYFTSDRNCSIRVKAKNEFGKVKMDGIISDDKLVLTVVNIEENTARDFVFEFYPLPVKQ